MPSQQRIADAGHTAPYLTHAVSHHGQVTLVPPDNAGRVRQAKPRKSRGHPGPERNPRSEEDIRFNTGPRPIRTLLARGGGRRSGRPGRHNDTINGGINEVYPDYPPPSFQEATSTPPISIYSSTTTLTAMSQPMLPPSPTAPPPPPAPQPFPQHHLPHGNTDADSDDSLEIIEMDSVQAPSGRKLEEDVRRDWAKRRGVEFSASPRGRTKSRSAMDSDTEQDHSPPDTPKKRHLSLSPLRTLFPYRSMSIPERAMSAHPSPGSSPYSHSRSAFPFLSTTSLKMTMSTSSFLRLPLTPASATSDRHDNILTRTLSSFKGKDREREREREKERERERHESLDAWEVVESDTILPADGSPRVKTSPTRSQSFTYGSPVESIRPAEITPISPPTSPNSVHPLSLRDRKAPPVPIVKRPKKHRPAPPPPAPAPPAEPVPLGPVLTSVRTRKPPTTPPKKTPQAMASSPLGAGSWKPDDVSETGTFILQRALEVPLPLTPVDASRFDYETGPIIPAINDDPHLPLTPAYPSVPVFMSTNPNEPQGSCRSSFDELREIFDQPSSHRDLGDSRPEPSMPAGSPIHNQISESGPSASRRHYPGRPLPRPPGTTRALVDSTYAGHEDEDYRVDVQCPEGLLIDLDDTSLIEHSGASTPQTDMSHANTYATPSSASSTEFLGSNIDSAFSSNYEGSTVSTPIAVQPPPTQFSEFTDLDVLVSRLNEGRRNGSDYNELLMLSEFIGPASPVRATADSLPISSTPRTPVVPGPNDNVPLLGSVEVERRRVTKDGRTKLKLMLIDASVDKCGICHTQFKSEEVARLGSICRHAFHNKCLARWLVQSKTCPMCRAHFVDADHL